MGQIARRLQSSLHAPDDDDWSHKRNYSPALAVALRRAYQEIQEAPANSEGYLLAYARLRPFRDQIVCEEQRLRLEYALALAFTGEEDLPRALGCLIAALALAERLNDLAAQVELAYLGGAILALLSRHADAHQVYGEALEALRELGRGSGPVDPAFELNITIRLAGCAWELGWFPVCMRHLDEAFALRASWASGAALEIATLAWMDAQLARVLGRPAHAFSQAMAAADLFLELKQPLNTGRSQIIAAESALDLTEAAGLHSSGILPQLLSQPMPQRGEEFSRERLQRAMRQAGAAVKRGLALAREVNDELGVGMARLAQLRYDRALGREPPPEKGIARIEGVMRTARRLGDMALLGRAETALGETFVAAGRLDAARDAYMRARLLLEEHELGGLAFWPRCALIQGGL